MNPSVRRFITSVPVLRETYYKARSMYNGRRIVSTARKVFQNVDDYRRAIMEERPGQRIDLYTHDGLRFTVRQNGRDAAVLAEVFLDLEYTSGFQLPENPIVVDIGGYIGDFAIYAAKYLKAKQVITIEPSLQNFALLEVNIQNNNLQDRIIALRKAVTDGKPAKMNIDAAETGQMRVSAYYGSSHGELKEVPGISLTQIVKDYNLPTIDLLKIDCEGGEYVILLTTPVEILRATRNIVFEYHEIDNFAAMLAEVKKRLIAEGFVVEVRGRGGNLISATR
jgi:FkbM family methyltransferase